ncbi:MAG: sodium:proton antiporter [Cyanobacteria bacterium SID2]|nr:sodium:proton antiporter [Cyanobacteria bacterium SID2]
MSVETLALIALFVLGFGAISGRLEKSPITPPMAFVAFGLLLSPQILGWLDVNFTSELVKLLCEITLTLVLFTDASRIDLKLLRQDYQLPLRLLGIGLPLTILFGTILALVLFPGELNLWEAAVLGTILAPTDAALGQAVVSNPRVPPCIRQSLNVESGLNDGICLPILLVFLSLAGMADESQNINTWLQFGAMQVLLGPVVGVAVGYIGGWLVEKSSRHGWITHAFKDLSVLGLSLLAYTLAELVGGNGFIAAFCAGLTLGNTARSICNCLYEFGEAEGQLLVLLVFMAYGTSVVFPALSQTNGSIVGSVLGSLLVARSIGVLLSGIGLKLRWDTAIFLGWFGPRGIASLLYALLVVEEQHLPGQSLIFTTTIVTVLVSVFAHGLSAFPGANWYGNRMMSEIDRTLPELKPVKTMRVRLPWKA